MRRVRIVRDKPKRDWLELGKRYGLWGLVALVAVLAVWPGGGGVPDELTSVFSVTSVPELREQIERRERIGVAFMNAGWCGYCRQFEQTTWADPRVQAWVRERAIVAHVDVDEWQGVGREFNFRGVPTTIFLKPDGSEIARIGGLATVEEFMSVAQGMHPAGAE